MEGYTRAERVLLRAHPQYDERWVQKVIASDPTILGLGELVLRDSERRQPAGGRLDLLLQDVDSKRRFEVELQLGATDESHIIRTIEYWDVEKKRYPQYDHCAVIIAEDITSRFLNVISLFNGSVPLIAIQMHALKVASHFTLNFAIVVNELTRGLVDEDEDAEAAPADRAYWETKTSRDIVALADELLGFVRDTDPALVLNYTKFYIGVSRMGHVFNFATFRPRKNHLLLGIRLPENDEVAARIEASGIETQPYDPRESAYRLRLTRRDLTNKADALRDLMILAYRQRSD